MSDGKADSQFDYTTVVASKPNTTPVANAGSDQSVAKLSVVTLNGSKSSDADGDTLHYRWRMISYPVSSTAQLSSTSTAKPSFTPDKVGSYVFELVVNDGKVNSTPDYVRIDVG